MKSSPIDPIEFIQKLVQCPSITPVEGGAIALLERTLKDMGFTCHRLKFVEDGTEAVENLYARYGNTEPNFCFAGHTDVVPTGEGWKYPPFSATIKNGVLYGRGTEDMKGGIGCFVSAVSRFLAENKNFNGSISFLITGDEEAISINGTKKVLKWLEEQGEKMTVCIVGEPTNDDRIGDVIKIGRRGSINTKLKVFGVQGHVAYPEHSDNPITKLVDILHKLKHTKLDDGNEAFQPSNLEVVSIDVGNPACNITPELAEAKFNIRFNNEHTLDILEKKITEIVKKYSDNFKLEFDRSGEAFLTKDDNFIGVVKDAIEKTTGIKADLNTAGGTSDARFIKDYCPVLEFGFISKTLHKVDEHIKVDDAYILTDIYHEVLKGYFS